MYNFQCYAQTIWETSTLTDGAHSRQDSMDINMLNCQLDDACRCEILKPLEQRRQREQKRCLAHSLVGTPNYIAPEVLRRLGESKTDQMIIFKLFQ